MIVVRILLTIPIIKGLIYLSEKVDRTLSLLYSSATTRGVAHRLTRNLALLAPSNPYHRQHSPSPKWDPSKPSQSYKPVEVRQKKEDIMREQNVRTALEEVRGMAEGWGGLVLGGVRPLRTR
jgi:hypothetical protein